MFRKNTVIVIGAGAGFDLNMPLGATLASQIAERLDIDYDEEGRLTRVPGNPDLIQALQTLGGGSLEDYLFACHKIRDGIVLANSIDDFLDLYKDSPRVVKMGKVGVVLCILAAEARSKLALKKHKREVRVDLRAMQESWLILFMRTLAANTKNPDHVFERVAFINFNYDRCLEHFLQHALRTVFDIGDERALAIAKSATILHPYGWIGPLTGWGEEVVQFGEDINGGRLFAAAGRIKTYTEQITDRKVLSAMRVAIRDAKQILFLGFAFHTQNMALITPENPSPFCSVFATAMGIGEEDRTLVRQEIGRLFAEPIRAAAAHGHVRLLGENVDCARLFKEYHKTLQQN